MEKSFSHYSPWSSLFSVYDNCLSSSHYAVSWRAWCHLLVHASRLLVRYLKSCLFSRLNQCHFSSLSLWDKCFSPLSIFVALCWMCFNVSVAFLYFRNQKCTEYFRYGLTSTEQRQIMTFLAVLLLKHPRMVLAFLVVRQVAGSCLAGCSPWFPGPSQQSCFPASQFLAGIITAFIPAQVQDFQFPLAEFHQVVVDPFL